MLSDAQVCPTLSVSDLGRAKKFYEEVLRLRRIDEEMTGSETMYECGMGTRLMIFETKTKPGNDTAAGFMVKDLAAEMTDLKSRGVVFEEYDFPGLKTVDGVATFGDVKGAWFKDPDGNILAISQKG